MDAPVEGKRGRRARPEPAAAEGLTDRNHASEAEAPAPPPLRRSRTKRLPPERLEEAEVSFRSANGDVSFKGRKPKKAESGAPNATRCCVAPNVTPVVAQSDAQSAAPEPEPPYQTGKYAALHGEMPTSRFGRYIVA